MVALDFPALGRLPFQSAQLTYHNGLTLSAWRTTPESAQVKFDIAQLRRETESATLLLVRAYDKKGQQLPGSLEVPIEPDPFDDIELPVYIERVGPTQWMDVRDGELMSSQALLRRYSPGASRLRPPAEHPLPPSWLARFEPAAMPTLIATARLDVGARQIDPPASWLRVRRQSNPQAASQIRQYVERISSLVATARSESLLRSQRADRQFPTRALDKQRLASPEASLREGYERIVLLLHDLHANGLAEESIGLIFPEGRKSQVERRILTLFLDDWEDKLQPLVPVHERLQLLREIVGEKMKGKSLVIGEDGSLSFTAQTGETIPVEVLSSGEQHLLALFTMLLFEAAPGSLVLIDEPEISLHAAWQHEFLNDLDKVAELINLRFVLATHSQGIINGRWDLVEELGL
jgi:ABC-type transport system involved in cytochrome c biogenesis ATPase subunit